MPTCPRCVKPGSEVAFRQVAFRGIPPKTEGEVVNNTNEINTDWAGDGIFRVTLNRPAKKNAITPAMVETLAELWNWVANADDVRVVALTGAGGAFSAGADLGTFARGGAEAAEFLRRGNRMVAALASLRKPVIAAVDGPAFGGGCELSLACALRLASPRAVFGLPEVTLGLIPAWGGVLRMAQVCGQNRALQLSLTGQPVAAAESLAMGLVSRVVDVTELEGVVTEVAQQLAKRSPVAVAAILELARNPDTVWEREAALFDSALRQPEAEAALVRFLTRRAAA
jgi:enoyl-CoA hydratase